jgi:glycosyltransferase involved in cell wall biosynthesis
MSSFLVFFTLFTLVILIGQLSLKVKQIKDNDLLENLTVVIPFRNEENNLPQLIRSLNSQTKVPAQLIFVNDHSSDNSVFLIESQLEIPYSLLHLENKTGKKSALQLGISRSEKEYILTLDSDVKLSENFFVNLATLTLKDTHILPVRITNKPFFGFFNLDYYYLFALNNGLHFLNRPFVASGANFLFKRKLYQQFLEVTKTQDIASGDDQYFLNYLIKNNKIVQQSTLSELTVQTKIPISFNGLLQQRIRWIKKSSSLEPITLILSLIGLIYHIGFYMIIFLNSTYNIELILTKIVFDCILFYPYLIKIGERMSFVKIAIFSLLYPFWILFIVVMSIFIQPKWKGRKIIFK